MSKNWRDITVPPNATVHQAWEVLDRGAMQIALVIDAGGHLAGTVTDGDIRRAVLRGKGLDIAISEVMNANPTTGLLEETHESWQRTMHRHSLRHLPIPPCRFADGRLRTFYHSDYFRSVVRHDDVPALDPRERELLDLYEEIAGSPEFRIDMELRPGDIQWLSNHTVVHARTAYRDSAHADGPRRHLLRLWLSIE